MSKKPAKDFTHMVVRDANYYHRVPREGDQPKGVFAGGTGVRLLKEQQGYAHVRSDRNMGWVSREHLEPLFFELTHKTTRSTPYYFDSPFDDVRNPPDGYLEAGTRVQLLGVWEVGSVYVRVRWTEAFAAVINREKCPLEPL
jgi:hypothetical protein